MEDAHVIYRLSRAAERRVFYIDVGNMPTNRAEQYIKVIMNDFRNKLVYDSCFSMDTKVPLLDGRTLSLTEISDEFKTGKRLWTYSTNPKTGAIVPGLITSAGVTRKNQDVMRLTFDNDKSVVCTLDHKFPIWDRGFIEAKDLVIGDSVIPFYTREESVYGGRKNSLYQQVYDNESKKWVYTHRMVSKWKDSNNILNETTFNEKYIGYKKQTVHHKNFNKNDNSPENLVRVNSFDHIDFHNSPEKSKLGTKALQEKLKDPEFHKKYCDAISNGFSLEAREAMKVRGLKVPKERFVEMSKIGNKNRWNQQNAKKEHVDRQTIEYPQELINLVKDCAKKYISVTETLKEINSNTEVIKNWKSLNSGKHIRGKATKNFDCVKPQDLAKISKKFGCSGFRGLRDSLVYHNHKIIGIEYLSDKIDVGTLGIDGSEKYHNYHTFPLDCGVFTKNSSGEVRDDKKFLSMQEDFFLPRREGGRGTEVTTLPAGCIALDTKIKLLDGRTETLTTLIEEFNSGKENWIYSCDSMTGKIVPGFIEWAGVTRKDTEVMKIYLDNGKDFICTPDHTIPIIGRGKVDAKDLVVGDSLIPLYIRNEKINKSSREYQQIYQNDTKEWLFTHRIVSSYFPENIWTYNEKYLNEPKDTIHHKDVNRFNNSPNNLVKMSNHDHFKYHSSENKKIANLRKNDIERYKEHCELQSKISFEYHEKLNLDPERKKEIYQRVAKGVSEGRTTGPNAARCKESAIENFQKGTEKVKELYKDPAWRENQIEKQLEGFENFRGTEVWKNKKKNLAKRNRENFLNPEYKEKVFKNQTIKFDKKCLDLIVDLIRNTKSNTVKKLESHLENAKELNEYFTKINRDTKAANFFGKLGISNLNKMSRQFGYKSLAQLVHEQQYVNHRIIKIEYLTERIDVGNLTIKETKYNQFHTYAIDSEVFIGNTNLGQIEDLNYFQERLYKALHVPTSRLKSDSGFGMGRSAEISRDEIKFSRFITKLRKRFDHLFKELLKIQLILKKVIDLDDWEEIREKIIFDYQKDSVFTEAKEQEIWTTRIDLLQQFDPGPVVDRYVTREWLKKNILRFTDDEIELLETGIKKEKPIADAEIEKTAALESGAFFDEPEVKPKPKKKQEKNNGKT
jgi:hypothetical protein